MLAERQQIDFLLILRSDQVMVGLASQGEDRRVIHLRVVQAVQQMDRPWSGRRETDAQAAGVLRVTAVLEGTGFLVPHRTEANPILPERQRPKNPVDAVTRKA